MVTTKTIRCVGRRMLLAFLASAGVAGVAVEPAAAQSGTTMKSMGSSATNFSLGDVPLAPGETIVGMPTNSGPVISHNGGSYQIIDASSVPMAADVMAEPVASDMPMLSSPSYGGYTGGCASGNCGGGCSTGTCGSYAGGMYGKSGLGMGGNACGPTCNPYLYAALDAVYVTNRGVENNDRTVFALIDEFDYEFGVRGTVGVVPDCRNGMEVSFVGPIDWSTGGQSTLSGGEVLSLLFPRTTIGSFNLNDIVSVTNQSRYDADYFSLEASRTLIGWEICKFLYGARYVSYDEDFREVSQITSIGGSTNPTQLRTNSATENQMIGGQVGLDMTYPLTCKLWSDFRGRAGAYANFAENQVQISTNQGLLARNFDDDLELAGLFEIGGGTRYYLTDDFHVRAGAEMWYLCGVATASDQFNSRNLRTRGINIDDDILMLAVTVGAELKF